MTIPVSVLYFFLIGSICIALWAIIGISRAMKSTTRLPAAAQIVRKDADLYSYATTAMLLFWAIGATQHPTVLHVAGAAMLTFAYAVVALALRGHAITSARIAAG